MAAPALTFLRGERGGEQFLGGNGKMTVREARQKFAVLC